MSELSNGSSAEELIKDLKAEALEAEHAQLAGEIVTRDDGSQLVRVRKRKRRSSQPDKVAEMQRRKRKLILVSCVFGIGFLGALAAICSLAFHNSNAYQEKLVRKISSGSGAEVKMEGLSVAMTTASAKSLQMEWSEGQGAIESIKLTQLSGIHNLGGFFGAKWAVPEVTSQGGILILRDSDSPALPLDRGSVQDIEMDNIRCSKMDVYWQGEKSPWLKGLQMDYISEEGGDKISVLNGYFGDRQLEEFKISNGVMRLSPNAAVLGLYLDHEKSSGSVRLEGEMPYGLGKEALLEMHITRLPIRVLVGDQLGSLLEGTVDAERAELGYLRGQKNGIRLAAELSSEVLSLSGFSFLPELSSLFNKQWYNRPIFDGPCSFNLKRKGNAMSLTELTLEAKAQLKITGDIHIDDAGNLSGKLQVGVPLAFKSMLVRELRGSSFTEARGGYLWQEITLSGTVNAPEDDLSDFQAKSDPDRPTMTENENQLLDRETDPKKLQEQDFEELTE